MATNILSNCITTQCAQFPQHSERQQHSQYTQFNQNNQPITYLPYFVGYSAQDQFITTQHLQYIPFEQLQQLNQITPIHPIHPIHQLTQNNQINELQQLHNSSKVNESQQSQSISNEQPNRLNTNQCVPCGYRKPMLPSQTEQCVLWNQSTHSSTLSQNIPSQQQYQQYEQQSEIGRNIYIEEETDGSNNMETEEDDDISGEVSDEDDEDYLRLPPQQLPLTPHNLRFYKNLYWFEKVKRIEEWLEVKPDDSL